MAPATAGFSSSGEVCACIREANSSTNRKRESAQGLHVSRYALRCSVIPPIRDALLSGLLRLPNVNQRYTAGGAFANSEILAGVNLGRECSRVDCARHKEA